MERAAGGLSVKLLKVQDGRVGSQKSNLPDGPVDRSRLRENTIAHASAQRKAISGRKVDLPIAFYRDAKQLLLVVDTDNQLRERESTHARVKPNLQIRKPESCDLEYPKTSRLGMLGGFVVRSMTVTPQYQF